MPYTDNKDEKFVELYANALVELKATEPNFDDDLRDADLTEETLKDEVLKSQDDIWKTFEVRLNSFNSIEESLKKATDHVEKMVAEFIRRPEHGESAANKKGGSQEQSESPAVEDAAVQEFRRGMELEMRLETLKLDLQTFGDETGVMIVKQIQERIRLVINDKLPINYSNTLNMVSAPGLAEITDPSRMIDTSAKASLTYMLDTMEGGCIGIAGSRGAGKSTLIQMCCGEKRTLQSINDVTILPVYTTAPVQYEPRDFILYLFSAVCQRLITMEGSGYDERSVPEIDGYTEPKMPDRTVTRILSIVPDSMLKKIGGGLMALGIVIAIVTVVIAVTSPATPTDKAAANQDSSNSNSNSNSSEQANAETRPAPALQAVFQALEIKPLPFLFWGGLVFSVGFLAQKLRGQMEEEARNDFPATYKDFVEASEEKRQEWYKNSVGKTRETEILNNYRRRQEADMFNSPLKKEAIGLLRDLKFQQSFTSGWSGAIKLPIGLEAGIQRAATLSQRQMSNPEIVASFVKFLRSVSTSRYKVVIGIDELDKMESDEGAQKFLNEIKSIFGLQNCFYLISVSENAMNQFERRGLPFRDVFDSSFDNVVYVDYLNYKTAKALIERRVIGKPIPFIYLSYCLSGGLPRDLIRNFRNLLELNQKPGLNSGGRSLEVLCKELVSGDIRAKIRAVVSATKKIETTSHSNELMGMIFELDTAVVNETQLLSTAEKLLLWRPDRITPEKTDDDKAENANRRKLEKLSDEFGSYLYFLITVLQFFNADLKELTLRRSAVDGDLDQLAKSRQLLGVNPNLAVIKLNILRAKWNKKQVSLKPPAFSKRSSSNSASKAQAPPAADVEPMA